MALPLDGSSGRADGNPARGSDLASKGLLDPREPTTLQNGQRRAMVSELAKKEGGQLGRLPKYEVALGLTYSLASQLGPDPYRLSSKGQPWLQNSRRLMFSQSRRPLTQSINRDCQRIVPYKANKQEWVHKNNRHVFRKPRYEIPDHLRPSFPWS